MGEKKGTQESGDDLTQTQNHEGVKLNNIQTGTVSKEKLTKQ